MVKHKENLLVCFLFFALLAAGCHSLPADGEDTGADSTPILPADSPTAGSTLEPGFRAPLWTFAAQGEVWSSPAVADGTVYFGSDDHSLYAVDLATHQWN